MDWISIIMTLLGGTSVLGVVSTIAYRKENKKLKRLEVKMSHNDKHWISDVDNNVWEPGVYGWTMQNQ